MKPKVSHLQKGITVVELLIVVAVILVLLTGGHSWFENLSVRHKISQALATIDSIKTEIHYSCTENSGNHELTKKSIGRSRTNSIHVSGITLAGTCNKPIITLQTSNTGLLVDPTLIISGHRRVSGHTVWSCMSSQLDAPMPDSCQG